MPNGKTDINNSGGFSTDVIGENWNYPEADYPERERIRKFHEDYTKGLLYFIGHDPRVPDSIRREMLRWVEDVCDEEEYDGSCMYDEYPDTTAMERMLEKAYDRAGRPEPEEWCRALLMSLLYDEICYRRNRRREFKQRLYPR